MRILKSKILALICMISLLGQFSVWASDRPEFFLKYIKDDGEVWQVASTGAFFIGTYGSTATALICAMSGVAAAPCIAGAESAVQGLAVAVSILTVIGNLQDKRQVAFVREDARMFLEEQEMTLLLQEVFQEIRAKAAESQEDSVVNASDQDIAAVIYLAGELI